MPTGHPMMSSNIPFNQQRTVIFIRKSSANHWLIDVSGEVREILSLASCSVLRCNVANGSTVAWFRNYETGDLELLEIVSDKNGLSVSLVEGHKRVEEHPTALTFILDVRGDAVREMLEHLRLLHPFMMKDFWCKLLHQITSHLPLVSSVSLLNSSNDREACVHHIVDTLSSCDDVNEGFGMVLSAVATEEDTPHQAAEVMEQLHVWCEDAMLDSPMPYCERSKGTNEMVGLLDQPRSFDSIKSTVSRDDIQLAPKASEGFMQQVEVRELPKEQCTENLSNHSDVQCTPSEPLLSLDKPQLSLSPRPLLRNGPLGKNEMGSQEDQREDALEEDKNLSKEISTSCGVNQSQPLEAIEGSQLSLDSHEASSGQFNSGGMPPQRKKCSEDTRYASSLLLEDVRPEVVPSVSNRESVTERVRPVSEELSYSSEVSSPLSDDSPGQQLINADNTEQEDKGEDVEEETTALSVSSTDHTSLSSRPRGGSPPGEVSTGCVNTEEEDGQGDDGESTSEELGTSVPCTEKTLQGAELVADGDSHCVALQSEFHSTRELNCVNLIVFLFLVVLSMLLWRSRSLRGVVNFVEILF
jgi:hypothetical protein